MEQHSRTIRMVLLDVDGVLTDNAVFIGARGGDEHIELKRFNVRDGVGIRLLQQAGIQVGLVSGRVSVATQIRAAELGIPCYQRKDGYKLDAVQSILSSHGLDWHELAFLGDDLVDLPILRRAGLAGAVADAVPEVIAAAGWTSQAAGGYGAVREFAEAVLRLAGRWDAVLRDYLLAQEATSHDRADSGSEDTESAG